MYHCYVQHRIIFFSIELCFKFLQNRIMFSIEFYKKSFKFLQYRTMFFFNFVESNACCCYCVDLDVWIVICVYYNYGN